MHCDQRREVVLDRIVIVGAGQSAAQAVATLRGRGFKGSIAVVGEEDHLPYQRPPLSKTYLSGSIQRDRLLIRQRQHYADHLVEVLLGRQAVEVDRRNQRLRLNDGAELAYDALLIATGSRPRPLLVPGAELDGVCYLRTMAQADLLRSAIKSSRRLVIIGGGYVGLEVAATCRQLGLEVTILEMADRVMRRVVGAETSAFYESEHARHGVRIICDAQIRALVPHAGSSRVRAVLCDDGSEHSADLVLIGIGALAADELAVAAGLTCSNGVMVDAHCRTSDPFIYAAGDCTNHPSLRYGGRVRLESVANAVEQASTAALNMLGESATHAKVPWFWSDQFDRKLAITGLSGGHDTAVTRGNAASRSFSVCYLREGELIAVETVGNPKDQLAARTLIAGRIRPNSQKLADAAIALEDCA